jgi:hypothetical protein
VIRNAIIIFGLLAATSAAGFAISRTHDAFNNSQRLAAVSATHDGMAAQDQIRAGKPASVQASAATMAPPPQAALPGDGAGPRTPAPGFGAASLPAAPPAAEPPAAPVTAAQDQMAPAALAPHPRPMQAGLADGDRFSPAMRHGDPLAAADPAPLTMHAPVFSHRPDVADAGATPRPLTVAPAPRYLIGVYR